MKKIILALILLILATGLTYTQNYFQKSYGALWENEDAFGVQPTNDGGFFICGNTDANSPEEVFLMKTNGTGDSLWTKLIGEGESAIFKRTSSGNYIIGGRSLVSGIYQGLIIKINAAGDTIWRKNYSDTYTKDFWDILEATDGSYVVAGRSKFSIASDYQIHVTKTDSMGNQIWSYSYGVLDKYYGYGIDQTSDGGYIITGRAVNGWNAVILKIDGNGNEEWFKNLSPSSISGAKVLETQDKGFLVLGSSENAIPLIKTDSSGTELWSKWITTPNNSSTWGTSIIQTSDLNYLITGGAGTISQKDLLLIKANSSGDTIWTRQWPRIDHELGHDLVEVNNNCYAIIGFSSSLIGDKQIYLTKTDSTGEINLTTNIGSPNTLTEFSVNVYPNPIEESSVILFNSEIHKVRSLSIYTTDGRLIKFLSNIESGFELSKAGLRSGVYFLQLQDAEGVVDHSKIIVK